MNTVFALAVAAAVAVALLWLARFVNLAAVPLWLLIAVTVVVLLASGFYAFLAAIAQGMDG